jgi:hypothetical protein
MVVPVFAKRITAAMKTPRLGLGRVEVPVVWQR